MIDSMKRFFSVRIGKSKSKHHDDEEEDDDEIEEPKAGNLRLQREFWQDCEALALAAKNYAHDAHSFALKTAHPRADPDIKKLVLRTAVWFEQWKISEACKSAQETLKTERFKAREVLRKMNFSVNKSVMNGRQWWLKSVYNHVEKFLDSKDKRASTYHFNALCRALRGYFPGDEDLWLEDFGARSNWSVKDKDQASSSSSVRFDNANLVRIEGETSSAAGSAQSG